MTSPTTFTWTDPTTNVDGSPIAAGEITGYEIGVRPSTGTVGTYPTRTPVTGGATVSEAFSAIAGTLQPGSYAAAVCALGAVNSAWSNEVTFTIAAPPPTPSAPTNFTLA